MLFSEDFLLDLSSGTITIKSILQENKKFSPVIDLTFESDETTALVEEVKLIKSHFLYGCFNYDEEDLYHGESWDYYRISDIEEYCNKNVPVPGHIVVLKFIELFNDNLLKNEKNSMIKNSVYLFDTYSLDYFYSNKSNQIAGETKNYFATTGDSQKMLRAIKKPIWIIPVYYSGHFSVMVAFNPLFGFQICKEEYNNSKHFVETTFTSVIHMDSLGNYHNTIFFQSLIRLFTLEVNSEASILILA
jgi:hypothetical protein